MPLLKNHCKYNMTFVNKYNISSKKNKKVPTRYLYKF